MNINLNNLKLLPLWDKLDFTEKGLLMTVILNVINNSIIGYIESEDDILNILNIKKSKLTYDLDFDKDKELEKYLSFNFSGIMLESIKSIYESNLNSQNIINAKLAYDDFIYYLWENKWKKNIFLFFEPINKELQKEFSFLKGKKGFFCKFLYSNINKNVNSELLIENKNPIKKKRTKKIPIELDKNIYDFENNELINNSICFVKHKVAFLTYTKVFNIINSENYKQNEENNYNIWTLGINLLSDNVYDIPKSRKQMGHLLKKYGKENLSKVIAEVSSYGKKPINVYAVFIKRLKELEKGVATKEEKLNSKMKKFSSGIVV